MMNQSKSKKASPTRIIVLVFGIAVIGVIIFLTVKFPSAIHMNYNIFKIIMAIAASAIAAFIPGLFEFRYKGLLRATGAIGVFAFLMFQNNDENSFDVRVVVTTKQKQEIEKNGGVTMILGKEQREAILGRQNDVLFENIPSKYLGALVSFKISFTENYVLAHPDSTYFLSSDRIIELPVQLDLTNKVSGFIVFDDLPVDGVVVSVGEIRDTSDSNGYYNIILSHENLVDEQTVVFKKDGYKMKRVPIHLQALKTLDITMEK